MKKFSRIVQGFAVVIGLLVLATSGQAALINFSNGDGTAEVTTGSGTITIKLTDTAINPSGVIQNISGFVFSTSSGSAASGLENPTAVGNYVSVARNKSYTFGGGPATWGYSGTSAQYVLTWNPGGGGTGPAYTIIGVPGGTTYSNANGSIANNGPHNPFIYNWATFVLDIPGITAGTSVTEGTIMFGTSWSPPSVPEAGTLLLFGTGLIGLVGYRRARRMQ